jgi:hypothetical protein
VGVHVVDVQLGVEMVHLVLENARVPPGRVHSDGVALEVKPVQLPESHGKHTNGQCHSSPCTRGRGARARCIQGC